MRKEGSNFRQRGTTARGNSHYVSNALGGDAFGGGRELIVRHGRGRQVVPFVCDMGSQAKGFL